MKYKFRISVIIALICFFSSFAQQITTDDSLPLEQLIQGSLGQNCVEISNISSTINGTQNGFSSFGYFERSNSSFPFENGIILTTGNVNSAGNLINTSPLNEGNDTWGTDIDLENALGIDETLNATSIQFNFVSVANQIQFNYILASEEYQQEYPCFYSDGFAFLIREAGSSNSFSNIALIPGTSAPVNTNTIHDQIEGFCPAENEAFFEGYNIGDSNYNGRTVVLSATATIQPNIEYEIKLVIADQNDKNFDSAVFIEGNSFNASVDLGPDITTCGASVMLNGDIQNSQASYQWFQNGIAIDGGNDAILEAVSSGTYKVEITIQLNQTSCIIEDTVEVTLDTEQSSSQISDFIFCDDDSNDGVEYFDLTTKDNEVLASVPPSNYNISYHNSSDDAENNISPITGSIQNTSSPQPIFVRIEDMVNGCLAFSTFNLVVNSKPEYEDPDPIVACQDPTLDGYTFVDLNVANDQILDGDNSLFVTYHYSQPEADLGIYPIFSPYANFNTSETLYVRIYNPNTGCSSTTTIFVEFQNSPAINQETQWINSCEQDVDGFENFDLTSVIENILQGLNDLNVSFHESLYDAQNNLNPIADPENYQNAVPNYQVIYIRVQDETTGCYTVTELELHANIIQSGFDLEAFTVCDDESNDGIENFDLTEVEDALEGGYSEFETVFYLTEEDRDDEVNSLDESVPFTVTDNGTTIYAIVTEDVCVEFVTVILEIAPAIILEPQSTDYCDDNNDGFTTLIMNTFDAIASQGVPAANVKYYLTEQDALNNENILPDYVYNSSNPQLLYIRVTNAQTGCFDISTLEINVVSAPNINTSLNPIVVCDDDQDGVSDINLETRIQDIVSNTDNLEITFYTNYTLANSGEGQIESPESFTTSSQAIFARVESSNTGCFSIAQINVYINTLPEFIPISNFENCEADITGVADFLFYFKDNEILNGQPDKLVLYYETEADAIAGTNPIDKYSNYQNTSSPQNIYVRVESYTDPNCFGTSSFEIEVGSLPIYNPATSIFICDDISNDGFVTIDLNETITEMVDGSPETLDITFHISEFDANNNINPVALDYTNSTNPQQLFSRVDNGNYCKGISAFEITIISAPVVNTVAPVERCDDNYDGVLTWNLTISELEILDVRQDNIVVSYFESAEDLEAELNPITNPENYDNITNPQTVYVKVNNTISNCFVTIPLDLIVNLPPPINAFMSVEICDNTTSSFDLLTINDLISDDSTDVIYSYHSNQSDADDNINPLDTNYIYTASAHTIIARLAYSTTGCYATYAFELIINPLPIANQPFDLEACDDISNDTFEVFSLTTQNAEILQGQDPSIYIVSYHNTLLDAESGENALPADYNAQNNETILVRVTNSNTSCFATTVFSTIVYPAPSSVNPITICDTDYDGINTFNLTTSESDLYTTIPNNVSISYFESIEDLDTNANEITNPTNYTNLSNPQTVYIKVFNNSANCYTTVPLELSVNLPPQTNAFEVFEICENEANSFDLNIINEVIVDNGFNVLFSYFISNDDAITNENSINTNYTYTSSNDIIYVRVEYSTTHCYYVYPFELRVNPLPIANQPNNLVDCDDDFDGLLDFDLQQQTSTILGSQNSSQYSISYFNNIIEASEGVNAIDSELYIGFNNEIITARIENNTTGCFNLIDFILIVNPKPYVDITDQVVCIDNLPLVVSAETFTMSDSYLWSTNEITPEIEITEIGTYSVTVTSEFGCVTTSIFNVTESESATIDLTETVDFSDPNNITITISGIGDYVYILDDGPPQDSNVFENVSLGYHTVTIIDLNGCAEVTKEVIVIDAPKFFTPNNDTQNDTWHIVGIETLPGSIIYLFDRYGKLITQLGSDTLGWDGTYNGYKMPSSDYWFLAEIRQGNVAFEVKGHFSLRR